MKKLILMFMTLAFLCGCSTGTDQKVEHNGKYENYIELIINNGGTLSPEIPFDYEAVISPSEAGYIYDVDIFNPRVAMYDVKMIAVDRKLITDEYLAPSLGVAEDTQFNMIPNQSNSTLGYYQRLGLNGIAPNDDFTLYMLVSYKDSTQVNEKNIFFTISSKDYLPEENIEEVNEETDDFNEDEAE